MYVCYGYVERGGPSNIHIHTYVISSYGTSLIFRDV